MDSRRCSKMVLGMMFLAISLTATGQSGGGYEQRRTSLTSGTARLSGGGMELVASAGLPLTQRLSGGEYQLKAGFWFGPMSTQTELLFTDGFED